MTDTNQKWYDRVRTQTITRIEETLTQQLDTIRELQTPTKSDTIEAQLFSAKDLFEN